MRKSNPRSVRELSGAAGREFCLVSSRYDARRFEHEQESAAERADGRPPHDPSPTELNQCQGAQRLSSLWQLVPIRKSGRTAS